MTAERPLEDARCWLFNTADRPVALSVNSHDEPFATIKPEEDQGAFTIDSDADGIYGTYTFEARPVGGPDDPPLASVSATFEQHDSYALAFMQVGDAEYDMVVYENDFSPSGDTRFEIRHTGRPETIDWRLFPNAEADPRIPDDERRGTLARGEWQQAVDVTENEYRLEIVVDGEVVAFRQDLELEANRMIVVYLVDDPQSWDGSDRKEDHIFRQEYLIQTGPHREGVVTPPAAPYATEDTNQTIQFDVEPVERYHTNRTAVPIAATDPDGIVDDVAIAGIDPYSDGFAIPDERVDRAFAIGGTTDATLEVTPKVPPASYDVTIVSNPESLGERATCTVPIDVKAITIRRLHDLVTEYDDVGDMSRAIADRLHDLLDHASALLDADETASACDELKQVITVVDENKSEGVSEAATIDIETETKALREYSSCG